MELSSSRSVFFLNSLENGAVTVICATQRTFYLKRNKKETNSPHILYFTLQSPKSDEIALISTPCHAGYYCLPAYKITASRWI